MARIYIVKKARKPHGNCKVCGKSIEAGDTYKWTKPRYRGEVCACVNCTIPLSMIFRSKMVAIYDAVTGIAGTSVDSIADVLHDLANTVREVGQKYQEGADAQREYFPGAEQAEENEQKAQDLDSWADEIESKADEAETMVSDLGMLEEEKNELEGSEDEDDVERFEEIEGELEKKEEELIECLDIAEECPV